MNLTSLLIALIMTLTRHNNNIAVGRPIRSHRTPERHASSYNQSGRNLVKRYIPVDEDFLQTFISTDYYDQPSEWNTGFENAFDEPDEPSQRSNESVLTSVPLTDDFDSTSTPPPAESPPTISSSESTGSFIKLEEQSVILYHVPDNLSTAFHQGLRNLPTLKRAKTMESKIINLPKTTATTTLPQKTPAHKLRHRKMTTYLLSHQKPRASELNVGPIWAAASGRAVPRTYNPPRGTLLKHTISPADRQADRHILRRFNGINNTRLTTRLKHISKIEHALNMPYTPLNLIDLYYGPNKYRPSNNTNSIPIESTITRHKDFNIKRYLLINNNTALAHDDQLENGTPVLSSLSHSVPKINLSATENRAYSKYKKQLYTRQQRIHRIWNHHHSILHEPREDKYFNNQDLSPNFYNYAPPDTIQQVKNDYARRLEEFERLIKPRIKREISAQSNGNTRRSTKVLSQDIPDDVRRNLGSDNIRSKIEPVKSHSFFRHAGKILGSASYAHIGFELDFKKLKQGIDEACACSLTDIETLYPQTFKHRGTNGAIEVIENAITSCEQLYAELYSAVYSFSPLDTTTHTDRSSPYHRTEYHPRNDQTNHLIHQRPSNVINRPSIISQPKRQKRQFVALALAGVVGLGSILSGLQIKQLWDDDGQLDQIVDKMNQQDLKLQNNIAVTNSLRNHVLALAGLVRNETEYNNFRFAQSLCQAEIQQHHNFLTNIFEAIYMLLAGKLHPGLAQPDALSSSLKRIKHKAEIRQFKIAVNNVNELYQLKTSYYSDHSSKVIVFVHLPLYKVQSLMDLYEHIVTPIGAGMNYTDTGVIRTMEISHENKYLARSNNFGYYRELSIQQLHDCLHTGDLYICEHQNIIQKNAKGSCLNAIFTNNQKETTDNCKVNIHRKPEARAVQIDAFRFLLYQPLTERIEVTCPPPRTNNSLVHHGNGMFVITLPPGCTTSTPEFLFSSMGNLGTYHHFIAVENRLNISKYMDGIPVDRFDKIIEQLTSDGNKAITIPKIHEAFHIKRNWIHRKPSLWVMINMTFYAILGLLLCYLVIMCFRPYKETIMKGVCPCRKVNPENDHPGVSYSPANETIHLNINTDPRPVNEDILEERRHYNLPNAPPRNVAPMQLGDV